MRQIAVDQLLLNASRDQQQQQQVSSAGALQSTMNNGRLLLGRSVSTDVQNNRITSPTNGNETLCDFITRSGSSNSCTLVRSGTNTDNAAVTVRNVKPRRTSNYNTLPKAYRNSFHGVSNVDNNASQSRHSMAATPSNYIYYKSVRTSNKTGKLMTAFMTSCERNKNVMQAQSTSRLSLHELPGLMDADQSVQVYK